MQRNDTLDLVAAMHGVTIAARIAVGEEVWLPVSGFGDYEVSSGGRVVSLKGKVPRDIRGRRLAHGHRQTLLRRPGLAKPYQLHRIVMDTFTGGPPDVFRWQVAHCNGVPDDNRLMNLRWDTPRGNLADMDRHGTRKPPGGKVSPDVVRYIRGCGLSAPAVAKELKMPLPTVCGIRYGGYHQGVYGPWHRERVLP